MTSNSATRLLFSNSASGKKGWLRQLAELAGVRLRTIERWWHTFAVETGAGVTSRQADSDQRDAFYAWLRDQIAQATALKAQKAAEAQAHQQCAARATMRAALLALIADQGEAIVVEDVLRPVLPGHLRYRPTHEEAIARAGASPGSTSAD